MNSDGPDGSKSYFLDSTGPDTPIAFAVKFISPAWVRGVTSEPAAVTFG
jgi:hypothetical protein